MVAGEVRGTPTVDRVAHILCGGHDDSKDDQEDDRVAVVEPVQQVVIVAYIDLRYLSDSADQTVHVDITGQKIKVS